MAMQALHTSATGMQAATTNIDVIANNLANQTTTGYKRRRAEFQDLLYIHQQKVGTQTSDTGTIKPTGVQKGLGVKLSAVYSINEQGPLEITDNSFDLAISGEGFFIVQQPDGTDAYTRAGSFQLNGDGDLVTADGYIVNPGITVPDNAINVTVNNSGEVFASLPGNTVPANLGQLDLVRFQNEAGLESIGQNLLLETEASGAPVIGLPQIDGFGSILQGMLEGSNVSSVVELTNLIKAQRAFEMNTKVMETANETMETFNQTA